MFLRQAARHSLQVARQSQSSRRSLFHSTTTLYQEEEKKGFFSGITNRLNKKVQEKTDNKANEQFSKTLSFMVESKQLTMDDFYEHLKRGFEEMESGGVRSYISKKMQADELKMAKEQANIFGAMTKLERMRPHLIKRPEKYRIAKEVGTTLEKVNHSITQYEEAEMFHAWVHRRHRKGLVLPKTAEESQKMFQSDKEGISSYKVNKTMMKNNRRPHAR